MTYSTQVYVYIDSNEVSLFFQNSSRSNRDMILQIYAGTRLIGESGRVEPGYMLDKLTLIDAADLSTGTYEGKFLLSYYDTITYEKEPVTAEIPVSLTICAGK